MKKKILLTVLLLSLIIVSGCAKKTKLEDGDKVVALIDGYQVTSQTLYEKLKTKNGLNVLVDLIDTDIVNKEIKDSNEYRTWGLKELENVKNQYTAFGYDFNQAITSSGYQNETEFMNYLIFNHKKEIIAKKFIKANLSDKDVETYYNDNITGELTIKHILITPDVTATMGDEEKAKFEKEAYNKALDIINKINNKEITFEQAVLEHTKDDATKNKEGLLAPFDKLNVGDYGLDLFNTAIKLKDEEVYSKPLLTKYGYHIIKKIKMTDKPEFDKVKDSISDTIVETKFEADTNLTNKTWVDIRTKYNIKINDTELDEFYKSSTISFK